uniref:Uncharacterized protein n=1 Tax=viral metagenome TaxID=1070528 RepID=A0A6M3Y079_9ZZZZ
MSEIFERVKEIIPSTKPIGDEFPVTFRLEDFGFTADQALVAGQWNRIGAYVVEAGMEYCVGRRFDGFIFADLRETANVQFHGKIRFVVTNPAETGKELVAEHHTREMGSISDKQMKPILPLSPPWVTQDSKIILEINPDVSNTLDFGYTISAIDLTSRVAK